MLSRTPTIFSYEDVTFKELDELNSLEQAFYAKFLFSAYDKDKAGLLWRHNPDELLHRLQKSDDYIWLIYNKSQLVGLWTLTEENGTPLVYFYLAPEYQGGVMDEFMLNFWAAIGNTALDNIQVNLDQLTPTRKKKFYNVEESVNVIKCSELSQSKEHNDFSSLFNHIKPYYV